MGQSRNENILENMLGASNPIGEPQSRIEELLIDIYNESAGLPDVDSEDNGKVLAVVNGEWDKSTIPSGNLPPVSSADENKVLAVKNGDWSVEDAEDVDTIMSKTEFCDAGLNLFDIRQITDGKYISNAGEMNTNSKYCVTDYIPVSTGKLWVSCYFVRYACFYDSNKDVYGDGVNYGFSPVTIPNGVSFVRLSLVSPNHTGDDEQYKVTSTTMINQGASQLPYVPYGEKNIKISRLPTITPRKLTFVGSASLVGEAATVQQYGEIHLTNEEAQPKDLKKNVALSFECEFSGTYNGILLGCGYNSYRGKWIRINDNNIIAYSYENSATVITTISHNITISDYIKATMYLQNDGKIYVSFNSKGGTFSTSFDAGYEFHGKAFALVTQESTNAKLTYSCGDPRKMLWMFGDSYFGTANDRVVGQLKNIGYFDDVLIDNLAGQDASGAYTELNKLLMFGVPKFLVWCLGMNGSSSDSIDKLDAVKSICDGYGIELIGYKVPCVPNIDHTTLNTHLESLGIRYIDAYKAVGSDAQGNWYTGYLSSDNVHPTELGAAAIAMQFLIDCPEIMQYGRTNVSQS